MKLLILLFSLISLPTWAVPIRCATIERDAKNDPIAVFKINPRRTYVDRNGHDWNPYYLGISPAKNFPFSRFRAYGQGD
jgi:hypothetical protein